jgi:putative nucleotidyltransferase with HDIG domain
MDVIRLIQDTESPNEEVARAIEYDPSLTSNILRLANSAYFGHVTAVSSIRDGILLLGRNRVFQLVVASTVGKMARKGIKGYDLAPGDLWDHLIGTAIGTRKLGEILDLQIPDSLFTAGLLHDIGKIVLGTYVDQDATSILSLAFEEGQSFEQAEQQVLGIDHAEVGACLLEHWNLPAELVEVVRWHHEPERLSADTMAVNLVHMADVSCLMAGVGAGLDALSYRPSSKVTAHLGLDMNALIKTVYDSLNELMEVRKLFNVQ